VDSDKTTSTLQYAARKAAQNQFFLAKHFTEFRFIHGMTDDDLAQFLGCSTKVLPKLSLCRQPNPESPRFRSDVERIAATFNVQAVRLVQLIREVDSIKALIDAKKLHQERPEGLLAVARDNEINQQEPKDPNESSSDEEEKK
jgi:predicted alpha/beta hydrolase family esterase